MKTTTAAPVKVRDSYDWLVLGDHPGAMLCAALIAKLGLSVIALPFGKNMAPQRVKQGPALDPQTSFMIGLADALGYSGLLARCLRRIELDAGLKGVARPSGPLVATPEARVEFSGELSELKDALERELGIERARSLGFVSALEASEGAFLHFWSGLPESLTIAQKPVPAPAGAARPRRRVGIPAPRSLDALADVSRSDRHAKPWFEGHPMTFATESRELFAGLWSGLCAGDDEAFRMRDLLTVFALARTGGFWPGGRSELGSALRARARELGVHFPAGAECKQIFIEGGRIVGVQLSQQGQMITVSGAAAGTPLKHVASISHVGGPQLFTRMKAAPRPSGWRFTLSTLVPRESMTVTGPWVVYKERGAPAIDCEFRDSDGPAAPQVSLNIRTVLPFERDTLEPEYQRLLAARMYRQVATLVPGLLEHARAPGTQIVPDFIAPGAPSPFRFESLDQIPDNLLVYDGAGIGSRSGIEGLFCVSPEAYPELGSLGEIVAAVEATAWIAHRNGIVGPFA